MSVDISSRSSSLFSSETRFKKMLAAVPDLISIHDRNFNIVYSNWNGFGAIGHEKRIAGSKCFSTYRDFSDVCQGCLAQQVFLTKEEMQVESCLPDGTWVDLRVIPLLDESGEVEMFVEWVRIITERKIMEEELRASEGKYKSYIDNAPNGVFVVNEKGQYIEANQAACELSGYSLDELLNLNLLDFTLDEYKEISRNHFETVKKAGQASEIIGFRIKNGARRFWRIDAVKLSEAKFIGFATDVTQITEVENELRLAHSTYKGIINSVSELIYIQNGKGQFLYMNDAAVNKYGYKREEVIGKFPDFLAAKDKNDFKELGKKFKLAMSGVPQRMEFWGKKADGSIFPKDLSLSPGDYFGEKVVIAVARDISEEKAAEIENQRLQAQLLHSQKMDSIGRLAGGVAHDFNNMLNVIQGHSELAMDKIGPEHPLYEDFQEIRKAARRSADLTKQLLAFARKQTASPQILDINETIGGMLKMLRRLIGENISLNWVPCKNIWAINLDPGQLNQILANLCVNGRDAIVENGEIFIQTRNAPISESDAAEILEAEPGEYVELIVEDDGSGMDSHTLANLFEPFFTTKEIGHGTGLGLATVYGIVKQNGGFIKVLSKAGNGTSFHLFFPRHEKMEEKDEVKKETSISAKSDATIMVVEDEVMILNMAKLMLERLGYKVIAFASPLEAIKVAKENEQTIDLLLTDVIMPEMNGKDLSLKIEEVQPSIITVFMSGYTANVIARHGVLDSGVYFLQKPFSISSLESSINEALKKVKSEKTES